ncbi:MAG: esterase family protein [Alphaproteobacteria bacterium]|nr:esterase family protein [Alphaproteobacteria bacterium]
MQRQTDRSTPFATSRYNRIKQYLIYLAATSLFLTSTVPAWSDGAGDIRFYDVSSVALGTSVRTGVYVPVQAAPKDGWPVLYLLHGLGGNESSWAKLGNIDATLDEMIASGKIAPLVVVMPNGGDSWYVNSTQVDGPGDYQTAFTKDLPTWIEAHFPVRTDRDGRTVAGLSMGGYGALRFALLMPQRYVAVAALSPAIWQNFGNDELDIPPDQLTQIAKTDFFERADPATILGERDVPPPGSHFAKAFGAPFNARFFNTQNVFTLLEAQLSSGADLPASFVTVGDDDSHGLWRGAVAYYETMRASDRQTELRITDGDHQWALWRTSIVHALVFLDSKMLPASLSPAKPDNR